MPRQSTCILASIYPIELEAFPGIAKRAVRQYNPDASKGNITYELAVCTDPNQPIILEIEDCFQVTYMGENLGNTGFGVGRRPDLVRAVDIAIDLVKEWAQSMVGCEEGATPAIWVVDGKITSAALAEKHKQQTQFLEMLVRRGNQAEREGRPDKITREMRLSAKILGKDDLPWVKGSVEANAGKKACPLCVAKIPAEAIFCPQCRNQIAPLPANLNFNNQSRTGAREDYSAGITLPIPAETMESLQDNDAAAVIAKAQQAKAARQMAGSGAAAGK